jgi:hypothetical protein
MFGKLPQSRIQPIHTMQVWGDDARASISFDDWTPAGQISAALSKRGTAACFMAGD